MYRNAQAWREHREVNTLLEVQIRVRARLGGMVNVSEVLINAVTLNKPNALIGLSQKGNVIGRPSVEWGRTDTTITGEEALPNPLVTLK